MSRYFWVTLVCWTLCLVPIGHASTAKSTKTVDPPPVQQQQKQQQQPQQNHHHHHHIRLTGYGSRSARKSIFVDEPIPTSPVQPKLWVQKTPDAVWFHSAAAATAAAGSSKGEEEHNSKRHVTSVCVRMVGNQWILETKEEEKDENAVVASQATDDTRRTTTTTARQTTMRKRKRKQQQQQQQEGWIPVEGLYGMYQMPSGVVIAVVTNSEEVLTSEPWGQIRRVRSIELIYLPHDNAALSQRQLHEEARQVRLLRQALKTHDFYYIPPPPAQPKTVVVVVESDTPKTQSKKNLKKNKKKKNKNKKKKNKKKVKTEEEVKKNRYVVRDMTQTLQRAMTTTTRSTDGRKDKSQPPFSTAEEWWESNPPDARFFWNQPAVEPLLDRHRQHENQQQQQQQQQESNNTTTATMATTTLLRHVIPVTSAFVGVQTNVRLDNFTVYDEVLISRRSRFRAGTRFTKRGADATGAVANYAETEQILLLHHQRNYSLVVASHVQIRGSIPLRWSSPADVKTYRPRVRIGTDPLAQARAMRNHLSSEWPRYIQSSTSSTTTTTTTKSKTTQQQQVKTKAANEPTDKAKLIFINLIDKKKDQGRLGRAFDSVLQAVLEVQANATTSTTKKKKGAAAAKTTSLGLSPSTVEHVWFDFHAEVKHGKWDKLSTLLGRVMSSMDQHGYFCASYSKKKGWQPTKLQDGVVRTNCMDCLDRTNVVQSIFGRYMLFQQLSNTPPVPKKAKKPAVESTPTTVKTRKTIPNKSVVAVSNDAGVGGFKMPLSFKVAFRRHASYLSLPWSHGEKSHRLLWADNADAISKLYAGTPALKGDFTRTGKRTRKGALDDGMNSLQRYYLNNFMDADRQEGMDLMVGYADFTVIDEDDEADYEEHEAGTHHDGGTARHPADDTAEARAMRLARSMLVERQGMETDVEDTGLLTARTTTSRARRWNRRIVSSPIGSPLEMRWIPGDLQSHVKDVASSMTNFTDALQAMDRRSLSFLPWWVVDDSDSDSELSDHNDNDDDAVAVDGLNVAASVNAGHILGGLIAAIQAPLATAASVVLLLGLPVLNH